MDFGEDSFLLVPLVEPLEWLLHPVPPGPVDTSSLVLSPQAVLQDYRGLGTRVLDLLARPLNALKFGLWTGLHVRSNAWGLNLACCL
jgi:hypothetical protein